MEKKIIMYSIWDKKSLTDSQDCCEIFYADNTQKSVSLKELLKAIKGLSFDCIGNEPFKGDTLFTYKLRT